MIRKIIKLSGKVQGVGFRPFVHNIATKNSLKGYVRNNSSGVYIDIEGRESDVEEFLRDLKLLAPTLSRIDEIAIDNYKVKGYIEFNVLLSEDDYGAAPMLPDIATCDDCLEDMLITGRGYKYAFTNCTNCGPRYSIIKSLPYDRSGTTMGSFQMCSKCKGEYENPESRRFHAQPTCCSGCGPSLRLLDKKKEVINCSDEVEEVIKLLKDGNILCVKGLTGYNLICIDRYDVVDKLRLWKNRPRKPLAVMMKNVETVKKYCNLSSIEENILQGDAKPIVILEKKEDCHNNISSESTLGVVLPYTPLHYLLFNSDIESLIFTSANRGSEPIIYEDEDTDKLKNIADYYLVHNRDIHTGVDDSVVKVQNGTLSVIRPGRGYYPLSIKTNIKDGIISCGSLLKNTISISVDNYVFTSPYIGDIDSVSGEERLFTVINNFKNIYKIEPQVIVYDLHPSIGKMPFINKFNEKNIGVYHHHAHIVSCMVENKYFEKVIGIAFDGLGYGEDGTLWGGEFLICTIKDFQRKGHINYIPLPGGDAATISPWKIGVSLIYTSFKSLESNVYSIFKDQEDIDIILKMLKEKINCPVTSSIGRLFDGVASILRFKEDISYEGEAAIYLEELAKRGTTKDTYDYEIRSEPFVIDTTFVIKGILEDIEIGMEYENIALKFHNTIIEFSTNMCIKLRNESSINTVALSGGVFQNTILLQGIAYALKLNGFNVLTHSIVPCNDSGISLGQMFIVNELIKEE